MSKLYIDGKLVGFAGSCCESAGEITISVQNADGEWVPLAAGATIYLDTHSSGECLTLPTYFCPHCAREALRGVDVSDPSGWRGK